MSRNIIIYPNRGTTGSTDQPYITFSGLTSGSINLVVEDDGSITFDGDTGSLFGISDNKDGLLHSVNDVSGLPIFQVYDNETIKMGKWDDPVMTLTSGGTININLNSIGSGTTIFNLGVDSSGNIVSGTTGSGGTVTGSGTANYVSKWTSGSAQGNSLIRDDATSLGIGTAPTSSNQLGMLTSTHNSSISIQNATVTTSTSYGVFINNYAVGATGKKIGIWAAGNTVDEDEVSVGGVFTSCGASFSTSPNEQYGIIVNVDGNQGYVHDSIGIDVNAQDSHSGDTYGLRIKTANAGVGNHYGVQIDDGTQSNGYVLTCDAFGNGSWQASAGGGIPEATTATTTTINFTGQTIYYNAGSPGTGNISENLTGAKLGLIQKIYHNDGVEPTYPAGWVLMGDAIYFTSTLNIIYAEWAGGTRVEYWYVQEQ